jgi:hypothetical protein
MDYILHQLDKKINFYERSDKYYNELRVYYQSKIEYLLIFILAYLWNENLQNLEPDSKERIIKLIEQPTTGQILEICRKLDINQKVLKRKINNLIDSYTKLRNQRIGHGFTYSDEAESLLNEFRNLILNMKKEGFLFLNQDIDLILVSSFDKNTYKGISYRANGDYDHWSCPEKIRSFSVDNLYGLTNDNLYFRLTPFIYLISEEEYFIFNSIEENLTGKVKYNRLSKTGICYQEWPELCELYVEDNGFRKKGANGTIINIFDNNYKRYIDVGIKAEIKKFITENKASVAATLWGHGGVGKTASIQSVCEELVNNKKKIFDYIAFLSAKDRFYDYFTGVIKDIDDRIDTFEKLIKKINHIICQDEKNDPQFIKDFQGKLLLIIDDYETFSNEDKSRIEEFIKGLDINHHKVVVTTRANLVIGYEIQTNELKQEKTKDFLVEIQNIEFPKDTRIKQEDFTEEIISKIHQITSGRPLFIFQFAYLVAQRGLSHALSSEVSSTEAAIKFLYGRIYDYLSETAQNVFVVMGFLTIDSDGDLSNLLEKNQYILNMEHRDNEFNAAVKELEKLRIIEIIEVKFFRVYSSEIQEIMMEYYHKRDDNFKRTVNKRLIQVSRDKKLDNELALLKNANASRLSRNEIEVVNSYKQILNRPSSPSNIKLQAILNLGSYLFADRGNKDEGIRVFEEYFSQFSKEPQYVKMYAIYHWSKGARSNREKAIQMLLDYFAQSQCRNFDEDLNIELLGILLTNRAIFWIEQREETKTKSDRQEITPKEHREEWDRQKDNFRDIYKNQGIRLFDIVKSKGYENLSSGSKQNTAAALYQFVEICIRLQEHKMGIDICNFAMRNLPNHYSGQFSRKLQLINKYQQK